ncbi:MAG: hypothetical protein U0521_04285 [Anaerolineae bacterium]
MMLPVNAKETAQIAHEALMGVVEVGRSEVSGAVTSGPVYEGYYEETGLYVGSRLPRYLLGSPPARGAELISAVGDDFAVTMSSSVAVCDYIDPSASVALHPILQLILLASRRSCHSKGNWHCRAATITTASRSSRTPRLARGQVQPAIVANHDLRAVVAAEPRADAHLPPTQLRQRVPRRTSSSQPSRRARTTTAWVVRVVEMEGTDAWRACA